MYNYIRYSMHGFNIKDPKDGYKYTIKNNISHQFNGHDFLEKIFIDEHITSITFYLKEGLLCKDYLNAVHIELEKICFNLIAYSELPISQPLCNLESIVDEKGNDIKCELRERMGFRDELICKKQILPANIFNAAFSHPSNFGKCEATYKKIFFILHSPHKVIQFLGLYDIMASLIHTPICQKKVHDYFGKNREKYPFITFVKSKKNPNTSEDSLTHLRNLIAHSEQCGVNEFVKVSQNISDTHIKYLLQVINNLLCEK